jgi:hypothetical protein
LDIIGRFVRGVHAKDGEYPTNGRQLGEEKPLGEGRVNFPVLIARLKDLGYSGAITIEREVNIVHDRGNSFISQREVRGTDDDVLVAARAALREDPDVLVLEQIRSGLLMNVALEAAASGHLVIGGFSAHNVTESIDRILDLYAPEYARQVQLALALLVGFEGTQESELAGGLLAKGLAVQLEGFSESGDGQPGLIVELFDDRLVIRQGSAGGEQGGEQGQKNATACHNGFRKTFLLH